MLSKDVDIVDGRVVTRTEDTTEYRGCVITQEHDNYVAKNFGRLIASSTDPIDLRTKVDFIFDRLNNKSDARKVQNPMHWWIKEPNGQCSIYLKDQKVATAQSREEAIHKVKQLNGKTTDAGKTICTMCGSIAPCRCLTSARVPIKDSDAMLRAELEELEDDIPMIEEMGQQGQKVNEENLSRMKKRRDEIKRMLKGARDVKDSHSLLECKYCKSTFSKDGVKLKSKRYGKDKRIITFKHCPNCGKRVHRMRDENVNIEALKRQIRRLEDYASTSRTCGDIEEYNEAMTEVKALQDQIKEIQSKEK